MATAKKAAAKQTGGRTIAAKKLAAKELAAKKTPAKKSSAKKASAKKSSAKKASAKKTTRKYDPSVGKRIERELDEMKAGTLKSGRSGKKVTNPKQAIAIALSEKRREGAKVPPNPNA